jgi:hypothetical protein
MTIGRIGRIQGEITVSRPATKAKPIEPSTLPKVEMLEKSMGSSRYGIADGAVYLVMIRYYEATTVFYVSLTAKNYKLLSTKIVRPLLPRRGRRES